MPFLFDENLRGDPADLICRHAMRLGYPLHAVQVGDTPDLPLGTDDPRLLRWAEVTGLYLVTRDRATMFTHFSEHLAAGRHSPGVFVVRRVAYERVAEALAMIEYASEADEWRDQILYVP